MPPVGIPEPIVKDIPGRHCHGRGLMDCPRVPIVHAPPRPYTTPMPVPHFLDGDPYDPPTQDVLTGLDILLRRRPQRATQLIPEIHRGIGNKIPVQTGAVALQMPMQRRAHQPQLVSPRLHRLDEALGGGGGQPIPTVHQNVTRAGRMAGMGTLAVRSGSPADKSARAQIAL